MKRMRVHGVLAAAAALFSISACTAPTDAIPESGGPQWLAGDHHIHSRYSVGWDRETDPPAPIIAGGRSMNHRPGGALDPGRRFVGALLHRLDAHE